MKRLAFAVPGDLNTPTGGYTYDRRIIAELRKLGWDIHVIDLGNEFPRPSSEAREAAFVKLKAVPQGMPLVIDGLAFGTMAVNASRLALKRKLFISFLCPLFIALENGTCINISLVIIFNMTRFIVFKIHFPILVHIHRYD